MASPAPSQPSAQSSSAPSIAVPYHSAYRGFVNGLDGRFDHFLRQPDDSHLRGGYWRFQSYDDERRAHACGLASPEELLLAHERGGERYDDIIIRWVRGMNDPSYHMALSGTAAQHLQTIYELRHLLGITMSFRGQIPVHPTSVDPRLKKYWEDVHRSQQQAGIVPALDSPGHPTPSPITPRFEQGSTSQSDVSQQQVQRSAESRATGARAAKVAQTKAAARATPPQRSPDAPAVRASQLSGTSPLSWTAASPQVQLPQPAPKNAPWLQSSRPPGATPSGELNANRTSRTIPTSSRPASLPHPQSTPGHGISQHNWVHQPSRSSTLYTTFNPVQLQQQAASRAPTDSRLVNRRPATPAAASPIARHTSTASRSQHAGPSGNTTNGAAAPLGSPMEREYEFTPAQLKVLTPLQGASTSVAGRTGNVSPSNISPLSLSAVRRSDTSRPPTPLNRPRVAPGSTANTPMHRPSPTGFPSTVGAPPSSPGTGRPAATPSRPHTPRTATPASSPPYRAWRNGHPSPLVPTQSSPARHIQGTPGASPAISKASPRTPVKSVSTAQASQELRKEQEAVHSPALTQDELNIQAFNRTVDMFGCVDCGLDTGHKWDCHIGSTYPLPSFSSTR
jgi:hypothetical protein